MSLRLWLPLRGDLTNNGVSNVTVTNTNATVDSSGKIGSCYRFNKNAYMEISKEAAYDITSGECSFCLWLNINSFNVAYDTYVQLGLGTTPWVAYRMGLLRNNTNSNLLFTISNGSSSSSTSYSTPNVTFGEWFHIACVYKPGHCLIYINGALHADYTTSIVPDFAGITTIRLGGLSSSYYKTDSSINDFRIYDHALSAKEVKEISKALVLHLPLDNNGIGNPNLIDTSVDTIGNTTTGWSANQSVTISAVNESGTRRIKCQSNQASSTPGMKCLVSGLSANTDYTISCYVQTSNISAGVSLTAWKSSTSAAITSTGYQKHPTEEKVTLTFNTGSETSIYIFFFMSGVTENSCIFVRQVKLELGTTASPYTPNIAAGTVALDVSGHKNNGTLWAYDSGGSIDTVIDTTRHIASTYINSNNNTTNTASGTRYIYGNCVLTTPNALTVAFWCKPVAGYTGATTQGQFSLTNNDIGANAGSDYQVAPFNHRDGIIDVNGSNGTTHKSMSITFTANQWHHYAIVYDGRYGRVYTDGVQTATCDMGSAMALGSMKGAVIGFSKAGGVWRSNKSYYSDFRLYATALSADDISDLYKISASVDDGGTMHAYDFDESGSIDDVSQQGVIHTGIDTAHYLVNNFSESGTLTDWTVGSGGALSNGVLVLTGANISVTSKAFPIGAKDIICVEFTVSVPTPSTTTTGPGIYIGTQYGQTGRAIAFNFTNKTYTEGTGSGTNNYFLTSYNSTATNIVKTFIIGSEVDIADVPFAERSVTTHGVNIMRILSGETTYIRTGYNSNSSMVINISNFKIYKINQHGICENTGEKSIGKGYLSFANYNKI